MDMDFGYSQNGNGNAAGSDNKNDGNANITNLDTGNIVHDPNGVPADDLDNKGSEGEGNKTPDDNNKPNSQDNNKTDDKGDDKTGATTDEPLQPGTSIEIGDEQYTVDEKGNVLDKNGNIYKEASEVKAWIDSFDNVSDTTDGAMTIDSIQEAFGIEITDDNDKKITFENSPAGVKAYIDAVIDTARDEHYEAAINSLYQKYPILSDVLNYYIANGNSLEGFGEMPDRSNITIDENNEAQQESIIRTAWKEKGQRGDVESYIAYLKSSGILLATAKEELTGLQDADKEYRAKLAAEAEKKENEHIKRLENYWNGVHEVVKSRQIAGYQIPESIIVNRNGQKLSVTPEDFFNYIYRVDKDGKSAYEKDLAAETPESRRDDEILRAYLKFVGGNYSNLVGMAINKEKVNTLKLKAKERNSTSVRINRPNNADSKNKKLDFGY